MADGLQELLDRQAISDVMARYARGIDERDFDDYQKLFDPDVEVEGFGPEPVRGYEAWFALATGILDQYKETQHMLGPVLAEIAPDGVHATGRTDLQAIHIPTSGVGRFMLWGTYDTRFQKNEGEWRIVWHSLKVRGLETVES